MILRNKAFTLIELLIVIAIIAILTVAFLPGALKAPAKARDAGRVKAINDIAAALESYSAEHNGKLPGSSSPYCLIVDTDLSVLASYFPNNTFPVDPKPTGNGACSSAVNKNAYFYKNIGSNYTYYIVGAVMEVQASANSSVNYATDLNVANNDDAFGAIKGKTLTNGGGSAVSSITPNATTPYYLQLGPK